MVHVRFVQGLVTVEGAVFLHHVDDWDITSAVGGAELVVAILEYGNRYVELVDKQADVVFLDATAKTDGNASKSLGFVFLDEILNFRNVTLAVRAFGTKVVYQERLVGEMAEQNSRVADSRQRLRKVHFHGLACGGILHQLNVCHRRFRSELCKRGYCCKGDNT